MHVHVGFRFDGPLAGGFAVVVQISVVGMRVEVFNVVRGYQPSTTNCTGNEGEVNYLWCDKNSNVAIVTGALTVRGELSINNR